MIKQKVKISVKPIAMKADISTISERPIENIRHEVLNIEPFTQMLHISDIHIRPLDRHDEFKSVFLKTREKLLHLSKKAKSVIVVTGDIFDHKSSFKPETFMLARDLIRMLTEIAPVIMIAGNHDMLEQNTSRLDALTPVTDGFNIHYLKWSGVYTVKNTNDAFVVSSLYDKQFIRHADLNLKLNLTLNLNLNYIALYHGDLAGASTDLNFIVENDDDDGSISISTRHKTKDDFDGFKAVLMGDIHKHQIFTNDIGSYIAYAGSLIQQNHGEKIDNHGILVWNKDNDGWAKPVLHEIINEYGFIDIRCENGIWTNKEDLLFKHSYARLLINKCTETQVDIICAELKREISNANSDGTVIITKKQALSINRAEEMTLEQVNPDLKRKEDEIDFIKQQAIENGIDGDTLIRLHKEYQLSVDHISCMSSFVWKPILIEFKNLFGYSGSVVNKIRFKDGCTSLNAPNAHGKSSTVNVILFGIFGRAPLNPSKSAVTYDVVNNNEIGGYIKVLLEYGNLYYLIERKAFKSKSKPSTSIELQQLTKYEFTCDVWLSNCNSDKISNCCDQKLNNNDKFIEQMFGDIDNFSLTNLLNKESSLDLISMTPSEQINILKGIFKMDVYDLYKDMNKKLLTEKEAAILELKQEVKMLKRQVSVLVTCEKLDELRLLNKIKQGEFEEESELLNQLKEKLSHFNLKITVHDILPVEKLEEIQEELEKDIYNQDYSEIYNEDLKLLLLNYSVIESKLLELSEIIKDVNFENIWTKEETEQLLDDLNDELSKAKTKIPPEYVNMKESKINSMLGSIETQIETLTLNLTLNLPLNLTLKLTKEEITEKILNLKKQISFESFNIDALKSAKIKHETFLCENFHNSENFDDIKQSKEHFLTMQMKLKRDIYNLEQENLNLNLKLSRNKDYTSDEKPILIKGLPTEFSDENIVELFNNEKSVLKLKSRRDELVKFLISDKTEIIEELCDCYLIDENIKVKYDFTHDYRLVEDSLVEKLIVNFEHEKDQQELNQCIINIGKLEDRIKYLNDVKINSLNFLNLNQIKYKENIVNIILYNEKLDKCALSICALELADIDIDISIYETNSKIKDEIENLSKFLNYLNNKDLLDELTIKQAELILTLDYFTITVDIAAAIENLKYLKIQSNIEDLKLKGEILKSKIQKRKTYERYTYLTDTVVKISMYNEKIRIEKEFHPLQEELLSVKAQLAITVKCLEKIKDELTLLEFKVQKQEEVLNEISKLETDCVKLELEIKPYRDYNTIIGNKGIVSKLLYCKIKSLEGYINSILENFTQYKIVIEFDDKKQTMYIISFNYESSKALSTSRFSGYEKLVLQIAFKRALNKFSYNSKSSLIIIDEAFDCIDLANFDTKLKDLMNLITQDYSTCLAISQRDISHISDVNMTIKKINGISKLEVLNARNG